MRKLPWLSSLLLLLAYMGFGAYLHSRHSSDLIWWLALGHAAMEAACLTILWKPLRNFFLLGFQSDVGYTIMALVIASLAVVVVAWIALPRAGGFGCRYWNQRARGHASSGAAP